MVGRWGRLFAVTGAILLHWDEVIFKGRTPLMNRVVHNV